MPFLIFLIFFSTALFPSFAGTIANNEKEIIMRSSFDEPISPNWRSLKLSYTITVHDPITINSNQELEQFILNEGFAGNGTINNPYVISHLNVSQISIKNTNKYLLITENLLHDPDEATSRTLIQMENVSNIIISSNHFLEWYLSGSNDRKKQGIFIQEGRFITITNNLFESLGSGIHIWSSSNLVLSNNQFVELAGTGISEGQTHDTTLSNNTLSFNIQYADSCSPGIDVSHSDNVHLISNTIINYIKSIGLHNVNNSLFSDLTIKVRNEQGLSDKESVFIHVDTVTNVSFSNLTTLDERYPYEPPAYVILSVAFVILGVIDNLVITKSHFYGVQRAIGVSSSRILSLLINGSTFSNIIEGLCLWGSDYENKNIIIKNNVFSNITHSAIRVDGFNETLIRNVSISYNLFISTTIGGADIVTRNVDSLDIYRNNFINRIENNYIKRIDGLFYNSNSTNITISQNYFASLLGFDENNDNIMDVFWEYLITDSSPAIRPWPSRFYPYIYISPMLSHFNNEVFLGNTYRLDWVHAADTWGYNYSYDITLVPVSGDEVLIKQNYTQNFIDIFFDSKTFPGGKAHLELRVYKIYKIINSTVTQPMGIIKSNFFTIYSLPSSNSGNNNQGTFINSDTNNPTNTSDITPLERPLSNLDLFEGSEIIFTLSSLLILIPVYKKKQT